MDDAKLQELMVLTARRLADVKATQEIILKTLATLVGVMTQKDPEPYFEELRAQAREASVVYQEQLQNELAVLRQKRGPVDRN